MTGRQKLERMAASDLADALCNWENCKFCCYSEDMCRGAECFDGIMDWLSFDESTWPKNSTKEVKDDE